MDDSDRVPQEHLSSAKMIRSFSDDISRSGTDFLQTVFMM
jgi:hypothetical protein